MLFALGVIALTCVGFYVKTWLVARASPVFDLEGTEIVIHGIFKKVAIKRNEIETFRISRNTLCKVFDLSVVEIKTKSETIRIYCREITMPKDSLPL